MTQWKYFPDTTPPRGLPLRLEVKEKDQNTGTPEPYYGKTLFQGFAVFDGHDFIPHAYFGLYDDRFYEAKSVRGNTVRKRVEYKVEDFDDIAWAYLDIPSWWVRKEDKE